MYGSKIFKPLLIAIDLDDTITIAPEMFKELIYVLKRYKCEVWIVTSRTEGDYCDVLKEFEELVDKVVFTNQRAKHDVVDADIWIDDCPEYICHHWENGRMIPSNKIKKYLEGG